jgi:hypothetical protein
MVRQLQVCMLLCLCLSNPVVSGRTLARFNVGVDDPDGGISCVDRAEIVRLALTAALVERQLPDYDFIRDKKNILLLPLNITPDLVPKLPGINIRLMLPEEIQGEADRLNRVYYIRISEFKIEGSTVTISVDNKPMEGRASKEVCLCGGITTFEYRKENGKWVGKVVGQTIL